MLAGVVEFQNKLRSQRLKLGIASFSVMTGSSIKIKMNQRNIAAIHSVVDQ
jgi:hypothetical protein